MSHFLQRSKLSSSPPRTSSITSSHSSSLSYLDDEAVVLMQILRDCREVDFSPRRRAKDESPVQFGAPDESSYVGPGSSNQLLLWATCSRATSRHSTTGESFLNVSTWWSSYSPAFPPFSVSCVPGSPSPPSSPPASLLIETIDYRNTTAHPRSPLFSAPAYPQAQRILSSPIGLSMPPATALRLRHLRPRKSIWSGRIAL